VIGKSIVVDDNRMTIIGVAPASFSGEIVGAQTDVWLPVSMHDALQPHLRVLDDRTSSWLLLLGRRAPGVTLAQAEQEMTRLVPQFIASNAKPDFAREFAAQKAKVYVGDGAKGFSRVRATFETPLFTLMTGVALLLCIICANVANLLLARAIARGREMAVRLALGADRGRLVRQLLTESVVLAVLGAAVGLVLAWWGSHALLVLASDGSTIPLDLSLDLRVLAFTLLVSFLAVGLFGLVPAVRASRVELASTMRAGAQSVAGSALGHRGQRVPLGKLLIAGQVALSVVLLVGAVMLVRSLRNVESLDVGLDRDHLLVLDVDANARGYADEKLAGLAHTLRGRLASIPGVAAVAFSENGIFSGTENETTVSVPGFVARAPEDSSLAYDHVSPGYVAAIGGRLMEGRDIGTQDEGSAARVAVVNQSLARFFFPNTSAVGKFMNSNSLAVQIVGVMADTRDRSDALKGAPKRRAYFAYANTDTALGTSNSLRFEIRTAGDPSAVVRQVRAAVIAVDPALPIDGIDPLPLLMRQSIREQRLVANLATAFGALALLLASIGLYGVMTYAITRRTGEIGLRVALGAQRQDVVRMVLYDALRLVSAGTIVGLVLALSSTRLLSTQLHGVGALDPASIGAAIAVLFASAVIAAVLPALRASRVSPIVALRAE
ncbi:MAG TPA: ADOP family duplicated permease, partial [Gemmatimonadaceae bacterium]